MWASRLFARSPPAVGLIIRFLFIGSRLCSTLLSDPASRRKPLRFAITSPPSGCEEDLHPQAINHARRNRDRGESHLSSPPTPPDKRVRIRRFDGLLPCRTAQRPEVQRTHRRWWFRRSSSSIAGFTRSQLAQAQPEG